MAKAPDGRQYSCKPCAIAAARQRNLANPEAARAADRKYSASARSKANRKARREGPQRDRILEQKRGSWARHGSRYAARMREERKRDPERFREYYRTKYEQHREKILEQNRQWRAGNLDTAERLRIWRNYGLTAEEFVGMINRQDGRCEICGVEMHLAARRMKNGATASGICIDHDHETGAVRGLLCGACNKALGFFKDNPKLLQAAIGYLKKYKQRPVPLTPAASGGIRRYQRHPARPARQPEAGESAPSSGLW